jgi:hypothetical protein
MFSGSEIVGKTEAGRQEIVSRQRKLAAKARVLLIAIDGNASVGNLREHFAALGDVDAMVGELIGQGLVAADAKSGSTARTPVPGSVTPAPGVATPAPVVRPGATFVVDPAQRFVLAQKFMNETVVEALGLRAFFFTLKLERCASVGDLSDLMPEYERVLAKTRDEALLNAYRVQLKTWLG